MLDITPIITHILYNFELSSSFWGAFFAFVFFIIGQNWLTRREEKKELILNLKRLKEYTIELAYFFGRNEILAKNHIENTKEPISIFLNNFCKFPEIESIYFKVDKHEKVADLFIKFFVVIRVMNDEIEVFNVWLKEMSDLSRQATINNRVEQYRVTMEDNLKKMLEAIKEFRKTMENASKEKGLLLTEINNALAEYNK